MRILIFVFISMISISIYSAEKKLADLYSESKSLLEKAQKNQSKSNEIFASFIKSIEDTKNAYEKKNPELGTPEETNISVFYYALNPVIEISKLTTPDDEKCLSKKQEIFSEDSAGKGDNAGLDKDSELALSWLKLFCKNI